MKSEVFDKDGKRITLVGNMVPDGATVRVTPMLMDAAASPQLMLDGTPPGPLHRPGSLPLSYADRDARQAAYEDRKRSLSDRWRHPAPAQPPAGAIPPQTPPSAPVTGVSDAEARYAERCAALGNAWRRP